MKLLYILIFIGVFFASCESSKVNDTHGHSHEEESSHGHSHEGEIQGHGENHEGVSLSTKQIESLGIYTDTSIVKNLGNFVEVNGRLEVPPQNEATVSSVFGANINSIHVIEGDEVKKGQLLATVSHPKLIKLQTDYIENWSQLNFLEKDYERQKKLYEDKVGSGKEFQRTESEYVALSGKVKGLEAQLRLINLNPVHVRTGKVVENIRIISPIKGFVRLVEVKIGQFVVPQTELFEIVNVDHVHADFMVYEKDIKHVKKGQKISFKVESLPNEEINATIYSVGKNFEEDRRAVHIHAEFHDEKENLLPGMYIRGKISVDSKMVRAVPEGALVAEKGVWYVFVQSNVHDNSTEFIPVSVIRTKEDNGWVGITMEKEELYTADIVQNNSYYLMAELKKSEAEHSH